MKRTQLQPGDKPLTRKTPMARGPGPKRTRAKKPAKPKPKSTTYWKTKCDTLWSKLVRLPGRCLICGATQHLQAHHLIGRRCIYFRHWPENGVCLCPQCHEYSLACSAHGSPWAFDEWMNEHQPKQHAWWTEHRHNVITGRKIDYEDVYRDLEAAWAEGQAGKWVQRQLGVRPEEENCDD